MNYHRDSALFDFAGITEVKSNHPVCLTNPSRDAVGFATVPIKLRSKKPTQTNTCQLQAAFSIIDSCRYSMGVKIFSFVWGQ